MQQKYATLVQNYTWTLTILPPRAHVIGCKWIFKNNSMHMVVFKDVNSVSCKGI